MHRESLPIILAGQRELGTRDRLGDTQRLTEPLGEGGLAGAELTDEQDEIALIDERGDFVRYLLRLEG
jgi:hypothetical protein